MKKNQSAVQATAEVESLQLTFKKKTNVEKVAAAVCHVINELACGSKKIDLSVHQSESEMVYVMIHKGAIITMHIQELGNALVIKEGGMA